MNDDELASRLTLFDERERIAATAPEDVDISDLDPFEAGDWDELQWAHADGKGMMEEPGFWEKAKPGGIDGEALPDWPNEYIPHFG